MEIFGTNYLICKRVPEIFFICICAFAGHFFSWYNINIFSGKQEKQNSPKI